MKYIKYGLLFFRKHTFTYILMILQLAFLLVAENILIASLNSRDVLYAPYENIISKDGYYFLQPYSAGGIWDENDNNIKSADEVLEETLSKLRGDYRLYCYYHCTLNNGDIRVRIIDDDIYNNLMLPLDSGYHSNKKNACLITKNDIGLKRGDTLNVHGVKLEISGVLTDKTYLPDYTMIGIDMSVLDLYLPYSFSKDFDDDSSGGLNSNYMDCTEVIAPLSAFEDSIREGNINIFRSPSMLIAFDKPLSEEDRIYNEAVLIDADCEEPGWLINFDQLQRKGLIYRNEDFNKMLPVVCCMVVIILIGVICSSAIISARQLNKHAVLYINGATPFDSLIISCVTAGISSVIAVMIALPLMFFGVANSFANDLGFVWGANNILAIIATVAFTLVSFSIIPAVVIYRKRYVMIREK